MNRKYFYFGFLISKFLIKKKEQIFKQQYDIFLFPQFTTNKLPISFYFSCFVLILDSLKKFISDSVKRKFLLILDENAELGHSTLITSISVVDIGGVATANSSN